MEKRKWLWKRKSSERSPGETESSESISSHSERYSDDQEALKASPNHNTQSPEVTSKEAVSSEETNDSVKILTEKLSAALVNVSAKEELVKQHAKVAEEAIAGWEKAENEVANFKQQLEAAVQQKLAFEDRVSHLDGALKECVRQLRQGREEQEQKIHEAVVEKTREWESTKIELESQIFQFQTQLEAAISETPASVDPDLHIKLESLERENSALNLEFLSKSEELEIMAIERDLSAQAAETASKQHLESIKKVAKLEAECRRLQMMSRKSSLANDQKSLSASSIYVESLTDSQSDSGERLSGLEIDSHKVSRDSWASALITELDQFKNQKNGVRKSITGSSLEIDIMDDFLEMERLAALHERETKTHCPESVADANQLVNEENPLKPELEAMSHRVAELEEKLKKIEVDKDDMQKALMASQDSFEASQVQLKQAEMTLEEMQREINSLNKTKEMLEFHQISIEVEARIMISQVESLKEEVETERGLSAEMTVKCRELEDELTRKSQEFESLKEEVETERGLSAEMTVKCRELEDELTRKSQEFESLKEEVERERSLSAEMAAKCRGIEDELTTKSQEFELQQTAISHGKPKINQEELDVAAGKLVECQKTIASLGRQLQSLATLEDFLTDTTNLPGFSGESELWKLHSNGTCLPKSDSDPSRMPSENFGPKVNGNDKEKSPASTSSSSASSSVSLTRVSSAKSRNGFGKLFSRSKSGIQLENQQA